MLKIGLSRSAGDTLRYLKAFPQYLIRNLKKAQRQSGKYLEASVRRTLLKQRPEWPALSEEYLETKLEYGLDPRKLLATHIMMHSVVYMPVKFGLAEIRGEVTIPPSKTYPPQPGLWARGIRTRRQAKRSGYARPAIARTRISVAEVAAEHEFGLGHVKERPFFRPTAKEEADRVVSFFLRAVRYTASGKNL